MPAATLTDAHLAAAQALEALANEAAAAGRTEEAALHRAAALAVLGPDPAAPVPVVAGAAGPPPPARRHRRPAAMEPRPARGPATAFAAAVTGAPLDDGGVIDALTDALNAAKAGRTTVASRPDGSVVVASMPAHESVVRLGGDAQENTKVMRETGLALAAAGGICAPTQALYNIRTVAGQQRPIRDALSPLQSDRGRIVYARPPTLAQMAAGLTVWSNANDITPGSDGPATKAKLTVGCPDDVTVTVEAVVMRLGFGNFKGKFWPELTASYWETLQAAHARLAERTLLTQLDQFGPATLAGTVLGTARDVLAVTDRVCAQVRSRRRTDDDPPAQITCLMPSWLEAAMRVDFLRQAPGDDTAAVTDAELDAMFAARGVTPVYSPDIDLFGEQFAGDLLGWPSTVDLRFWLTGDVAFVDGGSLDLGVVRDSVLNQTNDAEMFAETFEAAAFLGGGEYLKVNVDVCADGSTAAAVDINPCSTGS